MQILPNGKSQFIDSGGQPLASGTVGFYFPGTLNPKPTYQDSAGTIANPNPVLLDSRGQAIIWGSGVYRQILKDASGVTIWDQITEDPNTGLTGDITDAVFVAGTDFTPGTSTQLTLPLNPGTIANTWIFFDAAYQDDAQATVNGATLTFGAPIPVGVGKVTVKIGSTIPIGTPNAGTVTDITVAAGAGINSSKLSYLPLFAGGVARTIQDKFRETVSVKDFGAKGDGVTDDTAALATARAYLAANAPVAELIFPAGTYLYTSSPNWAIQNASIRGVGEVHLKYTGTGDAVVLDGSSAPNLGVYDMTMENFTVDALTTSGNGVLVQNCHHSKFKFKVRGAGATSAGIKTSSCVCSHFENCEVSPNADGGWYLGAKPMWGFRVTGPTAILQTSYCTFTNAIAEACTTTNGAGIFIEASLGNQFYGGTSEGCATGIVTANAAAGCVSNKFFGMDMEANITQDIFDQGFQNEYWSCDTNMSVIVVGGALRTQFFGGQHQSISIASGASYPGFFGCVWNRNGSGTFVDGSGTARGLSTCFDHINNKPGPFSQTILSPSASPWTYTNTKGREVMLTISSGTISQVQMIRSGVGTLLAQTSGEFRLAPGDGLQITYSSAPNATEFTM